MSAFAAHPGWDFVTRLYGMQGVAAACLGLQERHRLDVTFMLFCLWHGSMDGRPLEAQLPALADAARDWHEAVVLPVRTARRNLKARQGAAAPYRSVLAAEIDCEHAELLMLAHLAETLCGRVEGPGSPAVMASNLDAFFAQANVVPADHDRPAIAALLDAATLLATSPE